MALRIFETDPDAMPKPRQSFRDDVVGRFRSGMISAGRPVSLSEWRVTTGDPDVATAISGMYGGHPEEWETTREDAIQVLTNMSSVNIIIDGAKAISSKMVLWGANGVRIHECDGVEFLDEDQKGQPCGCPPILAARKELARKGRGPKPDVSVRFKLADDPDLGIFRFQSASWDLVRVLHQVENSLDANDGPSNCTLTLEQVEFEAKNGERKGQTVRYTRPVIQVHGSA